MIALLVEILEADNLVGKLLQFNEILILKF